MACAVCARVLDAVTTPPKYGFLGVTSYRHGLADLPEDHPAVPVPPDQVHTAARCDFCSADDPAWIVPARSFRLEAVPQAHSVEAWAALRRRVLAAFARREQVTPGMAAGLNRLYKQLRANLLGPPIRKEAPC